MTDLDPTEPVAGRPRRLALWWLLLAVVGVVGFVALRPGDDGLPTTGGAADTASDTTAATSDPPSPAGEGEAPTTEAPPAEVPAGEVPPAGGPDPGAAAGEPTDGDAGPTTTARRSIEAADADEPEPNTVGPAPVEGGCLPGYGGACVPPAPPSESGPARNAENPLCRRPGWPRERLRGDPGPRAAD